MLTRKEKTAEQQRLHGEGKHICWGCLTVYPLDSEHLSASSRCKECVRREGKLAKARYKETFEEMTAHHSCVVCGEDEPSAIDYHHVDQSEKAYELTDLKYLGPDTQAAELRKCVPLCANCHRKLHAAERKGRDFLADNGVDESSSRAEPYKVVVPAVFSYLRSQ